MKDKTNHIIEKATALFRQNGLHSVSMDDIAASAGISKKTLYENFQSKEMLVNMVVDKIISKTGKYLVLSPDISPNAIIEIENFSSYMHSVLEILTPAFVRSLKKYYPDAYFQLGAFRDNSIIPYLRTLFATWNSRGNFQA
ncbi:MAG: TetR/AcrR family transcriptional regulator [Bacteroidia bacterium]|nr:TetR/AcrR family transcriptional regulator [Bacteroidia bacterium]